MRARGIHMFGWFKPSITWLVFSFRRHKYASHETQHDHATKIDYSSNATGTHSNVGTYITLRCQIDTSQQLHEAQKAYKESKSNNSHVNSTIGGKQV